MKKLKFCLFMLSISTILACSKYDDSELWNTVNSLDDRVTSLEGQLKTLNSNIHSIKSLVQVLQDRCFIVGTETTSDGHVLKFSDGSRIDIVNGKDGADAPVINVRVYDGKYYWTQTINGQTTWLYGTNGEMISAVGQDAVTPLLKVDSDGYWIVSYDKGNTYSALKDENGNAVKANGKDGDSFFRSVEIVGSDIVLELKDGTEIILPIGKQSPYKAVDLGLSVRWASYNVEATTFTESGRLYLWGDANNTGVVPYYEAPNYNSICGTEYDIAHAMWGEKWRLPTRKELIELTQNCTWRRTTINGVTGMKVIGSNGNSIFLPPTGYGLPVSGPIGSTQVQKNLDGYYWTGESYVDGSERMGYCCFYDNDGYHCNITWNVKFVKMAIRAVKE